MKRVGYKVGQIKAVAGIPNWIIYFQHLLGRRHCRKSGHLSPYVCIRCGVILKRVPLTDEALAGMFFDLAETGRFVDKEALAPLRDRYVRETAANPQSMLELREWAKENGFV